jgi:uncharacterized protein
MPKKLSKLLCRVDGVRFFDTARMYQSGGSETMMGKLLTPKYRDDIYLMSKTTAQNAEDARRDLEDSLRALNTDYLDLWQVHSVNSPDDVSDRLSNGVWSVMAEAKASGKVRHIGFTGNSGQKITGTLGIILRQTRKDHGK